MPVNIRIGYGYDIHRLEEGRPLMLGGIRVSDTMGAVAHSDGDVLLHALCDAMLGAAALGDIGRHFPDTSAEFRGISSLVLLERTAALLHAGGWMVGNVDATVQLERPKISAFKAAMADAIASRIGLTADAVSIKATTMEQLGAIGEGRGIAAHAVVLITRVP